MHQFVELEFASHFDQGARGGKAWVGGVDGQGKHIGRMSCSGSTFRAKFRILWLQCEPELATLERGDKGLGGTEAATNDRSEV